MANSKRVGGKKSAKKKAAKKSRKKQEQGRKTARYNALRREGYGKAEAKRIAYGKGKKGKKGGGKKGRKSGGGKSKRHGASRRVHRASEFPKILAEVQRNEGTTGWPPTATERAMAEQILYSMYDVGSPMSFEERVKLEAAESIRRTKRHAAERLVSAKRSEEKRREEERLRKQAEAEISRATEGISDKDYGPSRLILP